MNTLLFYILSSVAVASSVAVVTSRRAAYGVLSLAVGMLALSALFILLRAYFIAVIQVLIYAGAILVLFLFVVMILGVEGVESSRKKLKFERAIQTVLALLFLSEIAFLTARSFDAGFPQKYFSGTVEAVGDALFTKYLLPFELVSGILLIGILGVVGLARKTRVKRT